LTPVSLDPGLPAEFSIRKPSGWPRERYKVEVTVDGKPGPSKAFKVQ